MPMRPPSKFVPTACAKKRPSGENVIALAARGLARVSVVVIIAPTGRGDGPGGTAQKLVTPSSPPAAKVLPSGENAPASVAYARSVPASLVIVIDIAGV